ncbi:LPXTG cell wall anchor domain-containing protein [Microbacterium sp.]
MTRVSFGLMIFGAVFGSLCAVLILTGVVSSTLWFTVIAMALLVISQGLIVIAKRRKR